MIEAKYKVQVLFSDQYNFYWEDSSGKIYDSVERAAEAIKEFGKRDRKYRIVMSRNIVMEYQWPAEGKWVVR